jgi:hypothetical protein
MKEATSLLLRSANGTRHKLFFISLRKSTLFKALASSKKERSNNIITISNNNHNTIKSVDEKT